MKDCKVIWESNGGDATRWRVVRQAENGKHEYFPELSWTRDALGDLIWEPVPFPANYSEASFWKAVLVALDESSRF